ncbi:centrosomal protein of 290 kDa-like [Zingiber officinale]|uniref:centrosomal protein of 290 kDa-like n=1 Tax=Zingiber officinale TaxID=94328 RepID=UPI001C4CE862|nr:centrosomal protein of 290 kDa-like [Zingiber officinale]XP_042402403.1 centrosomal protein of 290 kDa-like [Zingiber officinale]
MAEDFKDSSARTEVKLSEKVDVDESQSSKSSFTDLFTNENNVQEEGPLSDRESVKLERDILMDESERSLSNPMVKMETSQTVDRVGSSEADTSFIITREKVKELENELETALGKLRYSEAETASLNFLLDETNNKLVDMNKHCEELELGQKLMENRVLEAEQKYKSQLISFLEATDMKDKQLSDARKSAVELSMELDGSRKRIMVLEEELATSIEEMHKYEELSRHHMSQEGMQSMKILELENKLEQAHMNEKYMEVQISNLEKELKELHGEIEEKQVPEALQITSLELSMSQENLEILQSQVVELEQKLASKDAFIYKLTEEMNLHKISEQNLQEDVTKLENALSTLEEDLKRKLVHLKELEMELQEQMKEREAMKAIFNNQEVQISRLKTNLSDLTREKITLECSVMDLTKKLSEHELHSQLETKINLADRESQKTNSILSETLSYREDLEKKLKNFEQLHHESRIVTEASTNRNLELEALVQSSVEAEEGLRAQMKENEMRLALIEKKNIELEQQMYLSEVKCSDAENEKKEFQKKITHLTALWKEVDEENVLLRHRFKNYEDRIDQLESSLSKSSSRNSELEKELNDLLKTCVEHEEQTTATHQRSLELEYKINSSHTRAEDAERRAEELELSLEASNHHAQELGQLLSNAEAKQRDAEAELNLHTSKVYDLSTKLEVCQARSVTLESMLQATNEKERALQDVLNSATEGKRFFENLSKTQEKQLHESKNQIQILQKELKYLRDETESVQEQIAVSSDREKELLEKLKYDEDKVKQHIKAVEELTTMNLELNSLNESLMKDSELKLQSEAARFNQKQSEARELIDKLKATEEELAFSKQQFAEVTEYAKSLNAELSMKAMKINSLESNVEELMHEVSEANRKNEQTFADHVLLATSNSKLKEELEAHQRKVVELDNWFKSIHDEKEQLHETIEKYKQNEMETKQLHEKILELEAQLRIYEEQARESAVTAAVQNGKLEKSLSKLQDLERHVEVLMEESDQLKNVNDHLTKDNMSFSEELANCRIKVNELRSAFEEAITEKENMFMQLHSYKQEMEHHVKLLNFDKEELQSQITSIMDEKNLLNETYQMLKEEFETTIVKLEEELSKMKERDISLTSLVESHKIDLSKKSLLQAHISELEEKLRYVDVQLGHHIKSVEEVTARNLELNSLNEYLVKDSELKQQEAATSFKQKEFEARELLENIKSIEEKLTYYKDKALQATETVASLQMELASNAMKVTALENKVEKLNQNILETDLRLQETQAENELLATSNTKLKKELESNQHKVNELTDSLKLIDAEKEVTMEQLVSHADTIAKLMEEHSRGLEFQSKTELCLKENESLLHEAIEKHKQRDLEALDLHEKLLVLETQLRATQKEATDSAIVVTTQRGQLEEALSRVQVLEGIVEQLQSKSDQFKNENEDIIRINLRFSEELAQHENKMNHLKVQLIAATTEKEAISMQLQHSKKEVEDLEKLLYSDRDKLQSQITFIMEENNMLSKTYEKEKKEYEGTMVQLEGKLEELKTSEFTLDSLVEILKAELCEKLFLQTELEEKLRYAEEQLEYQKKSAEEITSRSFDLNSLNESLVKDSELKLQEAAEKVMQKDLEAQELLGNLISLKEELSFYKEQAGESTKIITSLKMESGLNAVKLASLENDVSCLQEKLSEANLRCGQTLAQNELLATTNLKLKEELEINELKVNELNELLKPMHDEREATIELLMSHASTTEKFIDNHSKGVELQFVAESCLKEYEAKLHDVNEKHKEELDAYQHKVGELHESVESLNAEKEATLHEAIEKHMQKDLEARELQEKLLTLETQLRTYEKLASESAIVAETQKDKLEDALYKVQYLEDLIEQVKSKLDQFKNENESLSKNNSSLFKELASYETKINELQLAFDVSVKEREDISMQLHHSRKEMEDVMQMLNYDKEKLQSQVASVREENIVLSEMYEKTKKKLEETIAQLEEKLSEQKIREFSLNSIVETLKAEITEKSLIFEQNITYTEKQLEQQRNFVAEFTAKNMELSSLNESLIKSRDLEFLEAAASYQQKETETRALLEKISYYEELLTFYKEQALETAESVSSLKAELAENVEKVVSLDNNIEELKKKELEGNLRYEELISENQLLATSNSKLKEVLDDHQHTVNELHELLKSIHAEKDVNVQQLASHAKTIKELTDEHSRGLEIQFITESRLKENEAQLNEAIEIQKQRELEARDLLEKLLALETQVRMYELQTSESAVVAASQKGKLEESLSKIQDLEGLIEQLKCKLDRCQSENEGLSRNNTSLSEELAEFQVAVDAAILEKENLSMLIHSSKREMEDLMQVLMSDKEKLHSQITPVAEENTRLTEMYQKIKNELETTTIQLEEKISEQYSRELSLCSLVERLKEQLSDKLLDQEALEQKLSYAEEQVVHHKRFLEEVTARNMELNSLNESLLITTELKLQQSELSYQKKESEVQEFLEKLISLEVQSTFHREQSLEAFGTITSLKAELSVNAVKVVSLEKSSEKLQQKLSKANQRVEKIEAENESLTVSNLMLKEDLDGHHHKVNELSELVKFVQAEKESTVEKLASHANTIEKLTEEHSRGLELHLATESHLKEHEFLLREAMEAHKQRDLDAIQLHENLLVLENQLRIYEKQASDSAVVASIQKDQLDESLSKIEDLEGIVQQLKSKLDQSQSENDDLFRNNISLSEELAGYHSKINELQIIYDATVSEREYISLQLLSSKKEMEYVIQDHMSEKEKLQIQIDLDKEENIRLTELYSKMEKELKSSIVQLEKKLEERMEREFSLVSLMEGLNLELSEKVAELAVNATKVVSLENIIDKFKQNVSEANQRGEEMVEANKLLAKSNSMLKEELEVHQHKVNELNELVNSAHAEKEVIVKELASHASTIEKLAEEHSRGLELHLATKSRLKENESLLQEAIQKHKHRDLEARELHEKVLVVETQLRTYEKEASESAVVVASKKDKLEKSLLKIQDLEEIVELLESKLDQCIIDNDDLSQKNLSLSVELSMYETKIDELLRDFDAVVSQKEYISMQLHSSKREMEEFTCLIKSDKEKLQCQVTSAIEENIGLSELYLKTKKELEASTVQLEEKINEQKEREIYFVFLVKSLNSELSDKVADLAVNGREVGSLENSIEELKHKVLETNQRGKEIVAQNELLATSNLALMEKLEDHQHRINVLDELVKSIHEEKEAFVEKLASHASTIEQLTEEHSRGLELQFATESHLNESRGQLHEAIEKHKKRDVEARDLQEKLLLFENLLRTYEEHVIESAVCIVIQEDKLEQSFLRIQHLEENVEQLHNQLDQYKIDNEGFSRDTLSLREELSICDAKIHESQIAFEAVVSEREDIFVQLHSTKREIEDLMQLLRSDKEKFQLEVTSIMEEKIVLNEIYQHTRKELESTIAQLEEKLSVLKARELSLDSLVESLKAELSEKSLKQEAIGQKLSHTEEQLEHYRKSLEEFTARNMELNSLNESLTKNSESEVRELLEKLNSCEEQTMFYKKQSLQASETVSSVKAELAENAVKVFSLENNVKELQQKVTKDNQRVQEILAENALLTISNSTLKEELEANQHKVNKLNELVVSFHSENEATTEQLSSQASIIQKLTEQHSRSLELQLQTESCLREKESQLYESIDGHKQRDQEATHLYEKLLLLEIQLRIYEEHANEFAAAGAAQKEKLKESLFRIQDLEGLVEQLKSKINQLESENEHLTRHNLSLSAELTAKETKINNLQVECDAAVGEKEDVSMHLYSSKREMENLMQVLNSEKENLQSQIISIMEEKIVLDEVYQKTIKEHEATIVELEDKLMEQKARDFSLSSMVENLNAELSAKSVVLEELRQNLTFSEEQLEHHRFSVAEATARNLELNSLTESLLKNSDLKLQEVTASFKEKESEAMELLEKFNSLEEQLAFHKKQASEATKIIASLKEELSVNSLKVISFEAHVEEPKEKASENNLMGEEQLASNLKPMEELAAQHDRVNKVDELLEAIHSDDYIVEKHTFYSSSILTSTEAHSRGLELQFTTESCFKENEARQHESDEEQKVRGLEAGEMLENLLSLETHLRTFKELASQKEEMEATVLVLDHENKKLHSRITSVLEENIMISRMHEKAIEELEATIVLSEEKLGQYKANEFSLNALVENLKAELSDKSILKAHILELEQKMLLSKESYTKEVESLVSAVAEKDAELTARMKGHASLIHEKNSLDKQLKQILRQLDMAHRTIMEQKKLLIAKEFKNQALKRSFDSFECNKQPEKQVEELKHKLLEAETQYKDKVKEEAKKVRILQAELNQLKLKLSKTAEMEMKIINLENALKLACTTNVREVKRIPSPAEMKIAMEVTSRDPGLDTSALKITSKWAHHDTEGEFPIVHVDADPSVIMAFKFILGVALVSVFIGIILGKRY